MKVLAIAALVALVLSGCATQKQWSATGGSRADATVRMSYEHSSFESPRVNDLEALNLAAARCKTWGYTGAEAFGGTTTQCNMPGGLGGCARYLVTKEFQCTGMGNKEPDTTR